MLSKVDEKRYELVHLLLEQAQELKEDGDDRGANLCQDAAKALIERLLSWPKDPALVSNSLLKRYKLIVDAIDRSDINAVMDELRSVVGAKGVRECS